MILKSHVHGCKMFERPPGRTFTVQNGGCSIDVQVTAYQRFDGGHLLSQVANRPEPPFRLLFCAIDAGGTRGLLEQPFQLSHFRRGGFRRQAVDSKEPKLVTNRALRAGKELLHPALTPLLDGPIRSDHV